MGHVSGNEGFLSEAAPIFDFFDDILAICHYILYSALCNTVDVGVQKSTGDSGRSLIRNPEDHPN